MGNHKLNEFMMPSYVLPGLRGATRLKSRATVDTYSLRNQKMLKVGVQLSVIMPSGKLNKP